MLDEWYKCYMDGTSVGCIVYLLDEWDKRLRASTSVSGVVPASKGQINVGGINSGIHSDRLISVTFTMNQTNSGHS